MGCEQLSVVRFGCGMIIVVFVGECEKGSSIEKDLQRLDLYRYR